MRIRLLSLLLTVMLLLGLAVPVSAAYENTYTNTGDQRADIVGVALTQVGYREGNNNYTKYGAWYGYPNHPWCGIFVSWCANQAGVPTSVIAKAGRANPWDFGFSNYYSSSEYTPRSGDLFFKKDFSHMGIVYYVDGSYVYTIEGNTNNSGGSEGVGVFIRKQKLSNLYYVSPNYRSDASHSYQKGYESDHPHKEYYRCSDCGDCYYTGSYVTVDSCKTCIVENCDHSYGSWTKASDSKHTRVCSKCENQQTASHSWETVKVTKKATCAQTGTKEQSCVCGAKKTVTVAKTESHSYGQWTLLDEVNHSRECSVCKKQEQQAHTIEEQWAVDDAAHWKSCSVCEQKVSQQAHSFADCAAPCETCAFTRESGHLFATQWSSDDSSHWYACEGCGEKDSLAEHACLDKSDDKGSWRECTLCGHVEGYKAHVPGPAATEQSAQNCTQCGYELMPMLVHVHAYAPMERDELTHWGTCACGESLGPEPHIWDVGQGKCAVCFTDAPVAAQQKDWDFVWVWLGVAGVAGIVITVTVTSVVAAKKRKQLV